MVTKSGYEIFIKATGVPECSYWSLITWRVISSADGRSPKWHMWLGSKWKVRLRSTISTAFRRVFEKTNEQKVASTHSQGFPFFIPGAFPGENRGYGGKLWHVRQDWTDEFWSKWCQFPILQALQLPGEIFAGLIQMHPLVKVYIHSAPFFMGKSTISIGSCSI